MLHNRIAIFCVIILLLSLISCNAEKNFEILEPKNCEILSGTFDIKVFSSDAQNIIGYIYVDDDWLKIGDGTLIDDYWIIKFDTTKYPDDFYEIKISKDGKKEVYTNITINNANVSIYPDMVIEDRDLSFNNTTTLGESLRIWAYVENRGNASCTSKIKFYEGEPKNKKLIGMNETVIMNGMTKLFNQIWKPEKTGKYVIYVSVEDVYPDELNNENNIASKEVNVLPKPVYIDLKLTKDDISFSNPSPEVGEEIKIYSNIHNDGEKKATAEVNFFLIYGMDIKIIGSGIVTVNANGFERTSVVWKPNATGNYTILVTVGNSDLPDMNLSNNSASRDIYVKEKEKRNQKEDSKIENVVILVIFGIGIVILLFFIFLRKKG
ncbi:MAG: hypothetical protein AB1779_06460 [Candidatus Thermoplasmatota archaeon]